MRWLGRVTSAGKRKYAYSVLVGEPDGKRLIWRPRLKGGYNIKMDLQEV
jgi:hypothetical protein